MSSSVFLHCALILGGISGVPLLLRSINLTTAHLLSTLMLCSAAAAGCIGALLVLLGFPAESFTLSLAIPFGPFDFGADTLSAWFLLPINLVCFCSALYGWRYWNSDEHRESLRRLGFFLGLLFAAMQMVVMAHNSVLFLIAFEVMTVATFFVMTASDSDESHQAGKIYLIMSHIAILALCALFSLLSSAANGYIFPAAGSLAGSTAAATVLILLALIGFGGKAGIMPLHVWLPAAHAAAPSHISAIMSGVILKTGIYGLVRCISFFEHIPLWWGILLLLLGALSGVAGVVFALGQHDMKRLLAYHSIENIGIIVTGIGVYCIGASSGSLPLMVLGLAGALLHVLNHAIFKALLFLSAGAAIHAAGTRKIDRMGGLGRNMPTTSFMFGLGAAAICGLPPLNGFVSEWFIYLGLFRGIQTAPGIAPPVMGIAAPLLALIGGLAVACFVKVYGVAFLGLPRCSENTPHEAPATMRAAMVPLALVCVAIGAVPLIISDPLSAALSSVIRTPSRIPSLTALAPLEWISIVAALLLVLILLLGLWYRKRLAATPCSTAPTWGCGYLAPTPRMQYSASSFADSLVQLFAALLRPQHASPRITGFFPQETSFHSHVPETVLERIYLPLIKRIYEFVSPLRRMQSGFLQHYMLYIFITLLVLLAWGRL